MQTLKERQNLHKFLERKAELAVRGEKSAQKRLSEAEAEADQAQRETIKWCGGCNSDQTKERMLVRVASIHKIDNDGLSVDFSATAFRGIETALCRTTRSAASSSPLEPLKSEQFSIASSSAEAELYALGASALKRIVSMMCDVGFVVKLALDAKATEHVLHIHGIGRMKHINVAHLWL